MFINLFCFHLIEYQVIKHNENIKPCIHLKDKEYNYMYNILCKFKILYVDLLLGFAQGKCYYVSIYIIRKKRF